MLGFLKLVTEAVSRYVHQALFNSTE